MRATIQRKQIKRHVALILNAETNRFIRSGIQFERTTNRFGKLFDGMILEQTKHFDLLPDAEFRPPNTATSRRRKTSNSFGKSQCSKGLPNSRLLGLRSVIAR